MLPKATCLLILVTVLQTSLADLGPQANANESKLQARIFLKTNSFDVEDKSAETAANTLAPPNKPAGSTTPTEETLVVNRSPTKRTRSERQKSTRRLSNIWSMLIPGSHSETDYDETFDTESNLAQANLEPSQVSATDAPSAVQPIDVATVGQSQNSSSSEASKDSEYIDSRSKHPESMQNRSHERFSTGSLTRDVSSISHGFGDLVSNGANGSIDANFGPRPSADGNEDQVEPKANNVTKDSNVKKSDLESSNFDRWLKRIQFQEPTTKPQPINTTHKQEETNAPSAHQKSELARVTEALADLRSRRQQNPKRQTSNIGGAVKGDASSNAPSSQSTRLAERNSGSKQQRVGGPPKTSAHPFQQQLVQHQAQLIHGIRYPWAQESTISVSAQEGASNTSLAFSQAIPPTNTPLFGTEVSQIVSNSSASGSSSARGDDNNNSNYPSQDEILRQVTSAISLDQQLNGQKRSESANNHRKQGELPRNLSTPFGGESDESLDGVASFFSTENNENQHQDGSTSASSSAGTGDKSEPVRAKSGDRRATSEGQSNNNDTDNNNIDKSYSLLGEKLRLLAMQQQQAQAGANSSLPSWLNKPSNIFNSLGSNATLNPDNLARLLASRPSQGQANQSSGRAGHDEKVASLLQQLLSLEDQMMNNSNSSSDSNAVSKNPNQLEFDSNSSDPANETPNLGWMPLKSPNHSSSPISPANLIKSRVNLQQIGWPTRDDKREHEKNFAHLLTDNQVEHQKVPLSLTIPLIEANDNTFELTQAQLEAAALTAANQLGNKPQQSQYPSKSVASNRPQNLVQSKPISSSNQVAGSRPHQLRPVAHLLPVSALGNSDEIQGQNEGPVSHVSDQAFDANLDIDPPNSAIKAPVKSELPSQIGKSPSDISNINDPRLYRQSNRPQAPNSHNQPSLPQIQVQNEQFPSPYYLQRPPINMRQPIGSSQYFTTIAQDGGPPIRLREVSLYRPFGFHSHHAFTYQPSPTVAALFPGYLQQSRPSLLRHMRPFRGKFSESQRLFSPLIPPTFADRLRQQQVFPHHHFLAHKVPPHSMTTSVRPIFNPSPNQQLFNNPMVNGQSAHFGPYQGQLKRQSDQAHRILPRWSNKGRVRHLDDEENLNMMRALDSDSILEDQFDTEDLIENYDRAPVVGKHQFSEPLGSFRSTIQIKDPKERLDKSGRVTPSWNPSLSSIVDQPSSGSVKGCTKLVPHNSTTETSTKPNTTSTTLKPIELNNQTIELQTNGTAPTATPNKPFLPITQKH